MFPDNKENIYIFWLISNAIDPIEWHDSYRLLPIFIKPGIDRNCSVHLNASQNAHTIQIWLYASITRAINGQSNCLPIYCFCVNRLKSIQRVYWCQIYMSDMCNFPCWRRLNRTSIWLLGIISYELITHARISYMHKFGKFIQVAVIIVIWSTTIPNAHGSMTKKQRY